MLYMQKIPSWISSQPRNSLSLLSLRSLSIKSKTNLSSTSILSKVRWERERESNLKHIHPQDLHFTKFYFLTSSFWVFFYSIFGQKQDTCWKMQLHISPSLRHVTVLPSKGVREFVKVKIASRRLSYRMLFYSVLFFTFILRFVFVLTVVETIDGETKCSSLGTLLVIWFCFSFFHMYVTYARTHKLNFNQTDIRH